MHLDNVLFPDIALLKSDFRITEVDCAAQGRLQNVKKLHV